MKLAVTCALLTVTGSGTARADVTFDEYAPGLERRAAQQLVERSCDLSIELRGAVVTVEQRQRLANPSSGPGPYGVAAIYEFDLPAGATITGFAVQGAGQAVPVSARSTTMTADERPMLGVDPALLVARPGGYAIYVQPFAADREVTLVTTYTAIAEVARGGLRIRLPGRGTTTACAGTVKAAAGPGTKVAAISIGATRTPGTKATFTLAADAVELAAELAFIGKDPVVWTQAQPLGDGLTASLVTVAAPLAGSGLAAHKRALFVIDGSRSMELVGKDRVSRVVRAVIAALPSTATLEAVIYDRTAARSLGAWQPAAQASVAIERAITAHVATNGSDPVAALRLAHAAVADGSRDATLVVMIGDGVFGDVNGADLTTALDAQTSTVDVLSVVLDPARTRTPGADALRGPVNRLGGTTIEVSTDELDAALATVGDWLRPSWHELALGDLAIPPSIPAGGGFTRTVLQRGPVKTPLTGHGVSPVKIAPRAAMAAPVATLALFAAETANAPIDPETQVDRKPGPITRYPYVHADLSFAVLSRANKIAAQRFAMVRSGGPYERVVAVRDPRDAVAGAVTKVSVAAPPPSAIAKLTLERLFRDQLQPKAFACYQRALGRSPKLAGTVHFTFFLGRGEVAQVQVAGLNEPDLDACLLDAGYQLSIPMPDFAVNADDQTIAHYPLTFALAEARPVVILGDADSSSPIDVDAIQGGVPGRRIEVDASTPLGKLRPTKH